MQALIPSQVTITWSNLSASVGGKILVNDSSGYAKSGQMLAIMGPSGAGKTTLLSLLAARKPKSLKVQGQVKANGCPYNQKQFYNFSNFVYQNDILFESMTVRQCIEFSAQLRIKGDKEYKSKKVDEMIQMLQLTKCQHTAIGGGMIKGVSGGERKRTCIAMEAITSPSVLILDEPTSGLDSFTSGVLLDILLKMTQQGKTIILTIHQPSSRLYNKLDRLILLNKGNTIYQGKANMISDYLRDLQIYPPENYNICDFFMLEISDYKSKLNEKQSSFNAVQYGYKMRPQIQSTITELESQESLLGFEKRQSPCSISQQMKIVMKRAFKDTVRNPMKLRNQFADVAVSIIIIGTIFYMCAKDPPQEYSPIISFFNYLMNVEGACFMVIVASTMSGMFANLLVFAVERQVFIKQSSSKYYSSLAYYIARTVVDFPIGIIIPIIFSSCVYFMLGLTVTASQFFRFTLTIVLMGICGRGLGIFMGSIFKDMATATENGNFLMLPLLMFSGILSPLDSLSPYINWMQYVSPFKYGLEAVVTNQFSGIVFQAISIEGKVIIVDPLQQLSITNTVWQSIGCLVGVTAGFYFLGYLCLRYFSSKLSS